MIDADFWKVPTVDEELYTMTSPPAREVLAENLRGLMQANPTYGTLLALEKATATRGGGRKIGKTTLGNILAKTTPINLDYVEILAKVFGLDPWQMLVPNLRPENPQILRATGPEEEALWAKLEELRAVAKQIDQLESSAERITLAEPIDDRRWHGTERRKTHRGEQ